jgi:hypothetical protein
MTWVMELLTVEELGKFLTKQKKKEERRKAKQNKKARMTVFTLHLQLYSS